jgi:diadenosine tetraphosphatase ApaH/serine/threonine PP2A family protein phosphatase
MRTLVISDVHANLTALDAVLADASGVHDNGPGFEAVWCLGDVVGYGPDPNECVRRLQNLPDVVCLIGNHDHAASGLSPLGRFNHDARAAASWTQENLDDACLQFLRSLPSEATIGEFTLAHGSPRSPVWEYILDPRTADMNFEAFETDYCLVGHSHWPLIFERSSEAAYAVNRPVQIDRAFQLSPRMILNPGSVGQPRDSDPRASYALLDTDALTWEMRRVAYDVKSVQERMLAAGLPERQALRLLAGW